MIHERYFYLTTEHESSNIFTKCVYVSVRFDLGVNGSILKNYNFAPDSKSDHGHRSSNYPSCDCQQFERPAVIPSAIGPAEHRHHMYPINKILPPKRQTLSLLA